MDAVSRLIGGSSDMHIHSGPFAQAVKAGNTVYISEDRFPRPRPCLPRTGTNQGRQDTSHPKASSYQFFQKPKILPRVFAIKLRNPPSLTEKDRDCKIGYLRGHNEWLHFQNFHLRKENNSMVKALELLNGAVDLHIHAGPSLMAREVDAWDSAQQAIEANLAAIVIKDHHLPSVGAVSVVRDHLRGASKLQVFGSIALNSPVGGLNPKAVEVAIGFGAKVVWMTTVSCKNHVDKHTGHGFKFPALKKPLTVREEPLRYLDAQGNLIPEAVRVLEVMTEHPDVVLATGHGNREEIGAIIRKAVSLGLKRILVDHPYYMIEASLEDMKAWQSLGAYIEFTAVTSVPASNLYCIPLADIAGYIKALGSERLILSSDYGQVGNGRPVDGLATFAALLREQGIEEKVLRKMLTENPSQLLNL